MYIKNQYKGKVSREINIFINPFVLKRFKKLPLQIKISFEVWARLIKEEGLEAMRKIPGYHDEPLRGLRKGQRSSRLNRAYRVIYMEKNEESVIMVEVLEVNKHEYR